MSNLSVQKIKEDTWEWWNELDSDTQEEYLIQLYANKKKL